MKHLIIATLVSVVACNQSAGSSGMVSPQSRSVFYCERQPLQYPERACHLQASNSACTDQSWNHGGCFESSTAYCFSHSLTIMAYCIDRYGFDTKEYAECEKSQHAWSELQTSLDPSHPVGIYVLGTSTTECDATLDECQSARRDVITRGGGTGQKNQLPPLLTNCRQSSTNEVNPF